MQFFGDVWHVEAFPVIERSIVDVVKTAEAHNGNG